MIKGKTDEEAWADGITKMATAGTRTKDIIETKRNKDYGFVFANQIDFIQQGNIAE